MNIVNEVAALQRLSVAQLRQRFADLFGEATNASNRTWLIKRIAWRRQALAEGDLSQRARAQASAGTRRRPPTQPAPQQSDHDHASTSARRHADARRSALAAARHHPHASVQGLC
ncbi:MAG TPA: DUF2924 domain-containing protein [Gemmataceae bacterium]|nr:DUF2924 domain-containing protein [Gemmataceae bacterium]